MKKEKIIILYSGGLDSTILLKGALLLKKEPHCVFIDYQQLHLVEKLFAQAQCKKLKVSFQSVQLGNLQLNSKLTNLNLDREKDDTISEWYVPARNMMFVSIVASIAESRGIHKIWYGANGEDRIDLFPDCTQEWIHQMNELLKVNSNFKVELQAPLIGIRKPELELAAEFFKINKDEIFSGYGKLENKNECK